MVTSLERYLLPCHAVIMHPPYIQLCNAVYILYDIISNAFLLLYYYRYNFVFHRRNEIVFRAPFHDAVITSRLISLSLPANQNIIFSRQHHLLTHCYLFIEAARENGSIFIVVSSFIIYSPTHSIPKSINYYYY